MTKEFDWHLAAVAIFVGALIVISYDILKDCFHFGQNPFFDCGPGVDNKLLSFFISLVIGIAYFIILKKFPRKKF